MLFYILSIFQKSFDFKGRASRTEYWTFSVVLLLMILALCALQSFVLSGASAFMSQRSILDLVSLMSNGASMALLFFLVVLISIAISVRRLHDIGKSGYWLFLQLVPIVGQIIIFIWTLQPSKKESNKYSPVPTGDDAASLHKKFG